MITNAFLSAGFYSWRDEIDGSPYIQCFCQELKENGKKYDILKLLTFVSQRVAVGYEVVEEELDENFKKQLKEKQKQMEFQTQKLNLKQIPYFSSSLTRILLFPDDPKAHNAQ